MTKIAPSKEDIQDLKMAENMRDLINTPGWKVYEKILLMHIEQKTAALIQPIVVANGDVDGITHVLVGEAAKGAIMGLRLALSLPSGIVAGAEQIRKKINPNHAEVEI